MKRRIIWALLCVTGVVIGGACSSSGGHHSNDGSSGAPSGGTVSVFASNTPNLANLIVAQEKHFFTGITVKEQSFSSGTAATQAFATGRGDVVWSSDAPSAVLWSKKQAVGFLPSSQDTDNLMVVARDGITGAGQMKGKKIATTVGSSAQLLLDAYLKASGMTEKDIQLTNLPPSAMLAAFHSGDIDGFVTWSPFGWQASKIDKSAHLIATAKGYMEESFVFSASPKFLSEHQADAVAFANGIKKAAEWITEHPDEAGAIVARATNNKDVADVVRQIKNDDWNTPYDASFRKWVQFAATNQGLPTIDWNTEFTDTVLKATS